MAWLLEVRRMSPLAANLHLLKARRVRSRLFLQRNIIQFYEDLPAQQAESAEDGKAGRSLSFATEWDPAQRRNSTTAARDVLRTWNLGPAGAGAAGAGDYGYAVAPPDWDAPGASARACESDPQPACGLEVSSRPRSNLAFARAQTAFGRSRWHRSRRPSPRSCPTGRSSSRCSTSSSTRRRRARTASLAAIFTRGPPRNRDTPSRDRESHCHRLRMRTTRSVLARCITRRCEGDSARKIRM